MRVLTSLIFLVCLPLFAEDDFLSDRLSKEIDANDYSIVDELADNERVIEELSTREQYFSERKKPWSPIPFRALLLKGTRLIDIKTGKVYFTSSDLYVLAQEETVGSQESYILNKDKIAKYKTFTNKLRSIEADVTLYPQVDPNKIYNDKQKHHSVDKGLEIESHLTFHIEALSTPFLADLYNGSETTSSANRFQSKTYYNSVLPIDFGISFGYQEGLWNEVDNQVKWSSAFYGPTLRWQFAKWGNLHLNTKFGIEKSFRFKAVGPDSQVQFENLLYEWEIEGVYQSDLGPFLFGWTLRNMTWKLKNTDTPLSFTDIKQDVTSTSFFAGYRIDVDL